MHEQTAATVLLLSDQVIIFFLAKRNIPGARPTRLTARRQRRQRSRTATHLSNNQCLGLLHHPQQQVHQQYKT
jgi:hypothetical protein